MTYKEISGADGSFRVTDNDQSVRSPVQPAKGLIEAKEEQFGSFHKTTIRLTGVQVAVADSDAFGGTQIYRFPEGRIQVLGAVASVRWAVTSARASTINDNAGLTWAVGTATASNSTLATAMVDLIPKTSKTLAAATTAYNTASTAVLASSAVFDGTGTSKNAYLNAAFETGTDIDGDGTMVATGYVVITWVDLGDI